MIAVKHKVQRVVFTPVNQKLIDFLDELQKLAKVVLGFAVQAIIKHSPRCLHTYKTRNPGPLVEQHV